MIDELNLHFLKMTNNPFNGVAMPIISTNDPNLHKRLKIFVAHHPHLTIGKAVELFTKMGLDYDLAELDEVQLKELKTYMKGLRKD